MSRSIRRPGRSRCSTIVTVDDVGRIINPLTLHGQVIGAAVQGLGSVFTEEIVYDENGQLLVGSLADYLVPVATDYPHVTTISLEEHPSPNNPLGAKGAGEGGHHPGRRRAHECGGFRAVRRSASSRASCRSRRRECGS